MIITLIIDYWSEPDEGDLRWVCVCRLTCRSWWSTPDFIGLRSDVGEDYDNHDHDHDNQDDGDHDNDDQDVEDGHDDEDEDEKDGNQTLMRFNNMFTLQSDVDHDGQGEDCHDHHEEEDMAFKTTHNKDKSLPQFMKSPQLIVSHN